MHEHLFTDAASLPGSKTLTAKYHTTTEQITQLVSKARPKLLVIYHTISFPPGTAPERLLPANGSLDALYASPEMVQKEISRGTRKSRNRQRS